MIRNKKAVSGVIVAVIMIALVMVTTLIVWGVVRNIVKGKLGDVESCFGIFGKVTINNRYTCYNSSSNELQFSISIGDVNVEKVLILISGEGITKSFEISNEEEFITGLGPYPSGSGNVTLPGKNSGLTYIYNLTQGGFIRAPDLIQITPIVDEKQCDVSDSLSEIDSCLLLT
ncbi:hypothetical protein ES703_120684 [subsurface metagenome]